MRPIAGIRRIDSDRVNRFFTTPMLDRTGRMFNVDACSAADINVMTTILQNLCGYWKFNEASPLGTAADSSKYGIDFLPWSGADTAAGGKFGRCLTLNGTSSYLYTTTDYYGFDYGMPFSFSVWVNPTSVTGTDVIFAKTRTGSGTGRGYHIRLNAGKPELCIDDGTNTTYITATNSVGTGAWKHIVFTYDGSYTTAGMNIYLDGSLETVSASAQNATTSIYPGGGGSNVILRIGRDDTGNYFAGLIDELAFFINRELTPVEVAYLYNGGTGIELDV